MFLTFSFNDLSENIFLKVSSNEDNVKRVIGDPLSTSRQFRPIAHCSWSKQTNILSQVESFAADALLHVTVGSAARYNLAAPACISRQRRPQSKWSRKDGFTSFIL